MTGVISNASDFIEYPTLYGPGPCYAGCPRYGLWRSLISAFVFALLSVTVKPVLEFFAWPLNFLSLGLVNWLIAGFILLLASWLPGGLTISSIWSAMLVAVAFP